MPRYELIIPPALAGRTVRQAAMEIGRAHV